MAVDESLLAQPELLIESDTGMLAATAGAGGDLRRALAEADREAIAAVAAAGRPRTIVVVGAGGSAVAGDVLAACAGVGSVVPVVFVNGPRLPGWVGSLDLVVAISASGNSKETLAIAEEAGRRGAQVVGICPTEGELADRVARARGHVLDLGRVTGPARARALLWRLTAPLILLGLALGVVDGDDAMLAEAADVLDARAIECGPTVMLGENPSKDLAVALAESLPLIWGTPGVAASAARRFGLQLAENAGIPSSVGSLPEVARTGARVLVGSWGRSDDDDIFRDRVAEPAGPSRPHLVLLTEGDSDPLSSSLAEACADLAEGADLLVTRRTGAGHHPLIRFADLIAPLDLASVYEGIALGVDPAGTAAGLDPRLGGKDAASP